MMPVATVFDRRSKSAMARLCQTLTAQHFVWCSPGFQFTLNHNTCSDDHGDHDFSLPPPTGPVNPGDEKAFLNLFKWNLMTSYVDVLFFTMHHSMVGRWIQIDHIAAKILFDLGNVIGHGFFNKLGHHITTHGFAIIASI